VRLFVAVEVPAKVGDVVEELDRPVIEGLRWTTRDQWHVTLRFLGEVPEVSPLSEALSTVPARLEDRVGHREVEAVLGPVTAWFPGRRILQAPVRGLDDVAACVADALAESADLGAAEADRLRFNGHLTLARMKGRRPGPGRLAGVSLHASWPVDAVVLMSSLLGPGGSQYRVEATTALDG
jgi:2'-5' RNA ligase